MNNKVYKKKGQTAKDAVTGLALGAGFVAIGVAIVFGLGGIWMIISGAFLHGIVSLAIGVLIILGLKIIPGAAGKKVADVRFNKNDMMKEIVSKIPQPFGGEIWTASDGIRVNEKVYKFKNFGYDTLSVQDYRSLANWLKRNVVWTDPQHVVVEMISKDHYSGSLSYGSSSTTYYETPGGHLGTNMTGAGANRTSTLYKVYIKKSEPENKPEKLKRW